MNRKFNLKMALSTLLAALIAFAATETLIYLEFTAQLVFAGIYFAVAAMLCALTALICERRNERINGRHWNLTFSKKMFKLIPLLGLAVMLAAMGLQFAYAFNYIAAANGIDDYIIVIDNSGSMYENDSGDERFAAAVSFLDKMNSSNRLAVYLFNTDVSEVFGLTYMDNSAKQTGTVSIDAQRRQENGGTDIKNALDRVFSYVSGALTDKRTVKLILLSDGVDDSYYSIDMGEALKSYIDKNIKIDTVLLTGSSNAYVMEDIAALTGGESVFIENADSLVDVYGSLIENDNPRNLLLDPVNDKLHNVLRVVFIMLISILISAGIAVILDNSSLFPGFILKGMVSGALAGAVLTYGLYRGAVPPVILRLILLLLICVILSLFSIRTYDSE